jgi:hypothetical protein
MRCGGEVSYSGRVRIQEAPTTATSSGTSAQGKLSDTSPIAALMANAMTAARLPAR